MSLTVSNKVFSDPGASRTILSFLNTDEVQKCKMVCRGARNNALALQKRETPAVFVYRKVFANQSVREHVLSFLSPKELDRSKLTRRSYDRNIQAFQRRVILELFSKASENLPIAREILERAPIVNGAYPDYQRLPRSVSIALGFDDTRSPRIYFKIECRAEGRLSGSKVIKRAVGSLFLDPKMATYVGLPAEGFPDADVSGIPERLARGESVDFDGTLPHRAGVIHSVVMWMHPPRFPEDRPSGWCCCFSRLIRKCFFSKDKFKITLGK